MAVSGSGLATVTVTGVDEVAFPAASIARAWTEYDTFGPVVVSHVAVNGAAVALPISVPSTKNSTRATPTSSVAAAVRVTVPATCAPPTGDESATDGAATSRTTIWIGALVPTLPAASFAVATSETGPITFPVAQVNAQGAVEVGADHRPGRAELDPEDRARVRDRYLDRDGARERRSAAHPSPPERPPEDAVDVAPVHRAVRAREDELRRGAADGLLQPRDEFVRDGEDVGVAALRRLGVVGAGHHDGCETPAGEVARALFADDIAITVCDGPPPVQGGHTCEPRRGRRSSPPASPSPSPSPSPSRRAPLRCRSISARSAAPTPSRQTSTCRARSSAAARTPRARGTRSCGTPETSRSSAPARRSTSMTSARSSA